MNKVIFGNIAIETLVAISESEQAAGLMNRSWPPPVMTFPADEAKICKFWMKNTPSPLDIIFCRAGRVTAILEGIPNSEKVVGPDYPSDLVVELPKGQASALGIELGTPVRMAYDVSTLARKIERLLLKIG